MENTEKKPGIFKRIWTAISSPFRRVWGWYKKLPVVGKIIAPIVVVGLVVLAFFYPAETLLVVLLTLMMGVLFEYNYFIVNHLTESGDSFWSAVKSLPKAFWNELRTSNWARRIVLVAGLGLTILAWVMDPIWMLGTDAIFFGFIYLMRATMDARHPVLKLAPVPTV